VSNLADAARAV